MPALVEAVDAAGYVARVDQAASADHEAAIAEVAEARTERDEAAARHLASLRRRLIVATVLTVPLLGGLLWKGATTTGAFAAMFAGGVIGVAAFAAGVPGPFAGAFNIDLALLIAFAVSAAVFVAVSLATRSPSSASS